MNDLSPLNWIQELHRCLELSSCRVQGAPVPLQQGFEAVQAQWKSVRSRDAAVWWVGNGGSSAICSHLSQDLMNKLGLRSHTLVDASLLTCMANDFGYPQIYARPLTTLARPGDLLIAISSSGRSENILNCAQLARERKMSLITLSAFAPDNPLWQIPAEAAFHVSTDLYGVAEVGHEALLHAAIETAWLKTQKAGTPS